MNRFRVVDDRPEGGLWLVTDLADNDVDVPEDDRPATSSVWLGDDDEVYGLIMQLVTVLKKSKALQNQCPSAP